MARNKRWQIVTDNKLCRKCSQQSMSHPNKLWEKITIWRNTILCFDNKLGKESKNSSTSIFAFMDEGSSVTLSAKETFLKWTSDTVREESNSKRLNVTISGNL